TTPRSAESPCPPEASSPPARRCGRSSTQPSMSARDPRQPTAAGGLVWSSTEDASSSAGATPVVSKPLPQAWAWIEAHLVERCLPSRPAGMRFVHECPGQQAGDGGEDGRDRDGCVEAGEGGGDAADEGADGVAGVAPEAVDAQGG